MDESTVRSAVRPAQDNGDPVADHVAELRRELDREDGAAELGIGWVVHMLRQGQVSTMFVDPQALEGMALFALDSPPWLAGDASEDAAMAFSLPAVDALIRAAGHTEAGVVVVRPGQLPHGTEAAALLRWPVRTAAID